MGTVSALLTNARYDLMDYKTGLEFDDKELIVYLNRMLVSLNSTLISLRSELVHGTELNIDTVSSQNFIDLTDMNNGQWDSIRSFWIGNDRKEIISLDDMYYKRKWYSGDAEPNYVALEGQHLIFETTADSAHTDVVIHYNSKLRPRLESYSQTVTATVATDILTPATTPHTFVTGDGPLQISNSGGSLPGGLSASTDYWVIYEADTGTSSFQLASSRTNAIAGTEIDITTTGSGTHTLAFTNSTDMMPYNGHFDELIREMLVMTARARKDGSPGRTETIYTEIFRKRAMEEAIRKNFVPKIYWLGF
jgi:hypothetical protein